MFVQYRSDSLISDWVYCQHEEHTFVREAFVDSFCESPLARSVVNFDSFSLSCCSLCIHPQQKIVLSRWTNTLLVLIFLLFVDNDKTVEYCQLYPLYS